ncbi:MAG: IclR family transcriptional regulator [Tepidisphaeraceae bacterium]
MSQDTKAGADGSANERTAVARIFCALEMLAEAPQTPSSLAPVLNVDRSTALRLLRQLEATGYVARDDATKRYVAVGARFLRLVSATPDHADLSELVDPVLRAIRAQHGEASLLAVPARGSMVYAAFFPSHHLLTVREQLGAVRPMHCSAVGKAYLSGLDDAAFEEELNRLTFDGGTEHAPKDRAALYRQVVTARQLGYAVDRDETSLGVSCVAVPMWIGGSLMGAIGITGPSTRLSASLVEAIGPELRHAAMDLRYHEVAGRRDRSPAAGLSPRQSRHLGADENGRH